MAFLFVLLEDARRFPSRASPRAASPVVPSAAAEAMPARRGELEWQEVSVGKTTSMTGEGEGLLCVTGGLFRPQDGAAGVALECEERACKDENGFAKSGTFVVVVVGKTAIGR